MTRKTKMRNRVSPFRPGRGFTLVEFTVVIVIISVLAAILFPVFSRARAAGYKAQCVSNLQQIGLALQLYARDHDGRFPVQSNNLQPLVSGYLREPSVLWCPDDWLVTRGENPKPGRLGPDGFSSYQYRGGLTIEDRWDIPVAADWDFRHDTGAAVLLLSGSVKWFKSTTWTPVSKGPRPLPVGTTLRVDSTPTPFLNDPPGTVRTLPPGSSYEE